MRFTASEVLEFVRENDVKFIRLAFCDLFGVQKNIAIVAQTLPEAFERGVCVDTTAAGGFLRGEDGDILLFPDPNTLSILPWRPSHGRVVRLFCDTRSSDGTPWSGDGRSLLRGAVERAAREGLSVQIGVECEFYLFQLDENGMPTEIPHDLAGYCDIAPLDKGENVRREICLALEDMNIMPVSSHHERGPGQNEISMEHMDALEAADALVSFRGVSGIVAARNGLHASFLPKPLPDRDGNSLHINLSLFREGENLFHTGDGKHSAQAESFMAGILECLPDLTLFLNPLASSYARMGDAVPREITWSHQNRLVPVRVPAATGEYSRMELRSPDPALNPYLAFALLVEAGLDGIERKLPLPRGAEPTGIATFPQTLADALVCARESTLVNRVIPNRALAQYCACKEAECAPSPKG